MLFFVTGLLRTSCPKYSRTAQIWGVFILLYSCRITKPLTFADCVGDELPLGWEVVYDQQVGVYYIDHINSKFSFLLLILNVIFYTSDPSGQFC